MQKFVAVLFLLLASTQAFAHVGSADVYYEGNAGPYHLFVTIRLPQVIPGIAELEVRSASPDVQSMKVVLMRLTGPGSKLPSTPDVAKRSKDDPQFFSSSLWLMEYGALQARIEVDGLKGKAELSIPVASFARQSFPMNRGLRLLAAFFMIFLTLSIVPTIGGIVRECTVPLGEPLRVADRRRSRAVMVFAFIAAVLILYGNRQWWSAEAAVYRHSVDLLKPPEAKTTLLAGDRLLIRPAAPLVVPVAGQGNYTTEIKMTELLPDHGHLMHLFLLGEPGMNKLWHLHPVRADDGSFVDQLPPMPAGEYRLFGDIVDKNGFPWTLVAKVDLPNIKGSPLTGDDSVWQGAAPTLPLADTTVSELSDGTRMVWERPQGSLKANMPLSFKFQVQNPDGSPVHNLQPYMGMAAHAEIVCSDLSVFAHIHPSGSVAMASLGLAQAGLMTPSLSPGAPMDMPPASASLPPDFSFPYGFPHPGNYRIFIQVKRAGHIEGAAFDAHVQ